MRRCAPLFVVCLLADELAHNACANTTCCLPACSCFFGDFIDKSAESPGNGQYTEIADVPAALAAVEEALADHNSSSKRPMPLAMFLFALEHVSRISRLMKQPGGHMLLVGVGGSGRQSLARLAAYMAGLELFQVSLVLGRLALISYLIVDGWLILSQM